mmetsp:Transcript_16725/g.31989  ORF Transcript_16725/g.31989 Transcript_16725/m.31989 type:complete len:239 (+) Transcript_16725:100-816(+)
MAWDPRRRKHARTNCANQHATVLLLAYLLGLASGRAADNVQPECGEGESLTVNVNTRFKCCTAGPVSNWSYSVDSDNHDNNVMIHVIRHSELGMGTSFKSSRCYMSDEQGVCFGRACATDAQCTDANALPDRARPERLCLVVICKNKLVDCNIDSYRVTFWGGGMSTSSMLKRCLHCFPATLLQVKEWAGTVCGNDVYMKQLREIATLGHGVVMAVVGWLVAIYRTICSLSTIKTLKI